MFCETYFSLRVNIRTLLSILKGIFPYLPSHAHNLMNQHNETEGMEFWPILGKKLLQPGMKLL